MIKGIITAGLKKLRRFNFLSPIFLLSIITFLGFLIRVINLNYNAPFSDEAIYVVVGQLGVFSGDWFSYNASNWLSGSQFIYPSLSALAYTVGDITGSRFLSVVAGTLLIVLTYHLTIAFADKVKNVVVAGLISAVLVAASTTHLFVSRLATMDMIAFVCLFGSLLFLQKQLNEKKVSGQLFFIASILLFLAGLIKLSVAFYFLLFILYGLVMTSKKQMKLFVSYFILPLIITVLVYLAYNFSTLRSFILLQASWDNSTITAIGDVIWQSLQYIAPFSLIGVIFSVFKVSLRSWVFLLLGALLLILVHLIELRSFTLDKHLVPSIVFLSILSGIGISFVLEKLRKYKLATFGIVLLVLGMINYAFSSYEDLGHFNSLWGNSTEANKFLLKEVKPEDKVLTEVGAATILATYEKLGTQNVSTFDYLNYQDVEGIAAYERAVQDGYFNYIELESPNLPKSESDKQINQLVANYVGDSYEVIYDKNGFTIYRRAF